MTIGIATSDREVVDPYLHFRVLFIENDEGTSLLTFLGTGPGVDHFDFVLKCVGKGLLRLK